MTAGQDLLLVLAGLAAGVMNTVVGSGTLITFPALLAAGLPPVTANVVNNIGLAPGSLSGAVGYRDQVPPPLRRTLVLGAAAGLGAVAGALLLLVLPSIVFRAVAPALIGLAVLLAALQPRLNRALLARKAAPSARAAVPLTVAVLLTSVYGGYFGAGQGVLLFACMSILMREPLQQVNGLKNTLQAVDNTVSAIVFSCTAHVDWTAVLLLATGATAGGQIGARVGRGLSATALRVIVVGVGLAGLVQLVRG
ncbi:membrane protein [Streptomyces albireticuli]|uniref:Probable membrane transporter protein n=1 Tax=Streptomyces albireticuli TaxID=1940 RepID=A0A1Z2LDH6_9ACTN|nr:sulfite exporter TauE/SafE family protein [Streptomyces albireticuli]ARZ72357.1 membrane protein [Streptomyces albireticuli]